MGLLPTVYDLDRPWVRQPCDTDKRWVAFVAYRNQKQPRSIRGALEAAGRPQTDQRTLERWSADDGWRERCVAFDRYLDDHHVAAVVDVLAEDARVVAARHVQLLHDAQEAAASIVHEWLERIEQGERLEGWSPGEVRGMIKDMLTLERLVRGEATERVEHGIGFDLSRLTLAEVETMRLLEAKAGVVE